MKFLGIDLGTANTYIYGCDSLYSQPKPVVLPDISDLHGSIATVVLYENNAPFLIGNVAEAEYFSQPSLQSRRRLATQFKPEIGMANADALNAARDFLTLLLAALDKRIIEKDTTITVGIPSLAREDFSINLRKCFIEAGWPEPHFVRESDAALVSCLQSGAIHIDDMNRKCMILDFGGGTCDFTTIESTDVLQNGGDALYGGRLFDDLFFQAFCAADPAFAENVQTSPFAWHAHWLECREQKEIFSDFINQHPEDDAVTSLRISWYDKEGNARESYLKNYGKARFLEDAENYTASADLLKMLEPYKNRGGLSTHARDMLEGRIVGLIEWLSAIIKETDRRREVAAVIITGGSSRWFFVKELAKNAFPAARIIPSIRGYEDIAFGLALFPLLESSRKKAQVLLNEKLPSFTEKALAKANQILESQSDKIIKLCTDRIVHRDIMPTLEDAQKQKMTAADLEDKFANNIKSDGLLMEIAREQSTVLRKRLEDELNFEFKKWLQDNGVPLAPRFNFPAGAIGEDFFANVSVKISRLDALNIMKFTLQKVLPVLAATATAGAFAHLGEPISVVVGGGAAFGATWFLGKTAPGFLERRKLPSFILTKANRKKIAENNREYIERTLKKSFRETNRQLKEEIQRRFHDSLNAMLASLSALNQVQTR